MAGNQDKDKKRNKKGYEEGPEEAALDAFERLDKTTVAGFSSEGELPTVSGASKGKSPIPLYGYYGDAFFGAKASQELLAKEQKRFYKKQDDYDDEIEVLEKALCEKYGVPIPTKWPNRRKDRGTGGEQLLILGQTVNDRRHPKLWGIRQEDRTRHIYVVGGSGSGKSLTNSQKVLSENGWIEIGKVQVGDRVYNRQGKLTPVTAIHRDDDALVWEIEFANGKVIEANGEHPWFVIQKNHGGRKEYVYTTEEMFEKGVVNSNGSGFRNRCVLCDPIEYPEIDLPIPPYVLGAFIGDGCLVQGNTITFSTKDQEMLDAVLESLGDGYKFKKNVQRDDDYGYTLYHRDEDGTWRRAKELKDKFRELDLCERSEGKFIPEIYLRSSVEQRRELLKGLMDTDGTAHKARISFCTISTRLRDDFCELVRSLGYDAHINKPDTHKEYKRSDGKCWTVSVLSNDVENIFKLQRKIDDHNDYRNNRSKTVIQFVERAEPQDFGDETVPTADLPAGPYVYGCLCTLSRLTHDVFLRHLTEHGRDQFVSEYPNIRFYKTKSRPIAFKADGEMNRNSRPINRILHDLLKAGCGTSKAERRIDERYFHASVEDRMQVLRGLVEQSFHAHGKHIETHQSSKALVDDLDRLFRSCGYATKIDCVDQRQLRHITYRLMVLNPDEDLIVDPKMLATFKLNGAFDGSSQRANFNDGIAIVDIRKTDRRADMTCLKVADGESYILEGYIVTHNSTLLHALGVEDMWYWRGGLLMEPHGDLAQQLLHTAPPYRLHDIVYLNVIDKVASPGFNPLELPLDATDEQRQEAVGSVTSLIAKHFNMDATHMPRLSKMLTNALNALSYLPGATLLEVMDFYVNEDIRNTALSFVPDGPQKDAMTDLANNAKAEDLATLENRMSRFTTNRFMRHLFGQSNTTLNFFDLMNEGKYIICPASKGGTTDDTFLKFYGSYIVSEIYKAALLRESIEEGDRVNFALVLDEFQNFMGEDIEGVLSEARKYGLMMMLANQYLDQLTPTIRSAILQNCATKLCYNLGPADAKPMAQAFGYGLKPEDMQNIPKYHVMAAPLINGGNVRPFISSVFPPISLKSEVSDVTADLIKEISRNKYMKPRDDIDKEISDRKERYASNNKDAIRQLVMKKNH